MITIGIFMFALLVPIQIVRERAWRKEHAGEELSRELMIGRYVFAAMGAVIVLAALIGP